MKHAIERLAAALLPWLAVSSVVLAQETTTGSIAGRIVDPQGAVVPEARVTLRSGQGARSLATDERGQFLAPYLTPGVYAVRVERPGFKPLEQRDVRLRLGQRVELDYTLSLGAFEELVDVTAPAPVVDARSTTAGGVLDSDELLRLPVSRRLTSTLYLVPGVSNSTGHRDRERPRHRDAHGALEASPARHLAVPSRAEARARETQSANMTRRGPPLDRAPAAAIVE